MFFPEMHEVRGLGEQILHRRRKERRLPQPTPQNPGGRDRAKGPTTLVIWN